MMRNLPPSPASRVFGRVDEDEGITTPSSSSASVSSLPDTNEAPITEGSPPAKPFDRWRPLGGGAEHDIFRRFKISASEEEAFLTHWTKYRLSNGIFSRDENGTLNFRISSTDMSELATLGIGRSDHIRSVSEPKWLQVYDTEGVSWVTEFCSAKVHDFSSQLFDTTGRKIAVIDSRGLSEPIAAKSVGAQSINKFTSSQDRSYS